MKNFEDKVSSDGSYVRSMQVLVARARASGIILNVVGRKGECVSMEVYTLAVRRGARVLHCKSLRTVKVSSAFPRKTAHVSPMVSFKRMHYVVMS